MFPVTPLCLIFQVINNLQLALCETQTRLYHENYDESIDDKTAADTRDYLISWFYRL